MLAEMNELGAITLRPETGAEAYALRCWVGKSYVEQKDILRGAAGHWRSSSLVVSAEIAGKEPT